MTKRTITMQAIRATYSAEKKISDKNNLWGYLVLRRISFHFTWLFLKLGISANQVTVLSLVVGLAGCGFLAFGNYIGIVIGVLLANIWALLDYVDGNIARYNKCASDYGLFLETWVWAIFGPLLFISVGLAAFNHPDLLLSSILERLLPVEINRGFLLFLGGWAALFYILHEFIYTAFARIFSRRKGSVVAEFKSTTINSFAYKIEANFNNISGILMPVLLLAAIFKFLSIFIFIWAVIPTAAFVAVSIQLLRRVKPENE